MLPKSVVSLVPSNLSFFLTQRMAYYLIISWVSLAEFLPWRYHPLLLRLVILQVQLVRSLVRMLSFWRMFIVDCQGVYCAYTWAATASPVAYLKIIKTHKCSTELVTKNSSDPLPNSWWSIPQLPCRISCSVYSSYFILHIHLHSLFSLSWLTGHPCNKNLSNISSDSLKKLKCGWYMGV